METLILIGHVLAALALIGLILLQQGKGAEAGASFGGGASQTIFGSQGAGNFLTRVTAILATVFFITSFSLALFAKHKADEGVTDPLESTVITEQPAVETDVPTLDESVEKKSLENDVPALDAEGVNEAESTPASEGSGSSDQAGTEQAGSDTTSATVDSTESPSSEVNSEQ
ncbi:preprotein translocase subunit SecG [Endozoicomonas sp. SM1973]|uniref:Protein-export membrane protein SecG n=1 Tax=Spartinivicinus marinus TaxID=2994442 RepID=A0A853IFI8_9GAMM|nr:preprotein translocase subunit SecG [Spartinivicinus marinus]